MSFKEGLKDFFVKTGRFFKTKIFLVNFGISVVLTILLLWAIFMGVNLYTQHNDYLEVPDFTGLSRAQAHEMADAAYLRDTIIDSIFQFTFPDGRIAKSGCVVEQIPGAGKKVKENRRIFLTVKTYHSEMVEVPDVTNISVIQAQADLENIGLRVGNIEYIIAEYKNLVLNQKFNNRESIAGNKLPKGSVIDLVVGMTGEEKTFVPNFVGESFRDAKDKAIRMSLNIQSMVFDNSVKTYKDSLNAKVWKQFPHHSTKIPAELGRPVDLWFTLQDSKVKLGHTSELTEAESQTQEYLDTIKPE